MTRVFLETALAEGETVVVTGDTARYLLTVLRSRPGTRFVAVDTAGHECEVVVDTCAAREVHGRVVAVRRAVAPVLSRLVLYQALLKNRNFELVLQKCAELGVAAFVPLLTERTVPRPAEDRLEVRLERWAKIVTEACRQCGRNTPPAVAAPVGWRNALLQFGKSGARGLIPYEGLTASGCRSLHAALVGHRPEREVAVFIGPEGGFTPREVDEARAAGLVPVSLGPFILRAETAAIAACSVVMYELGGW